MIDNFWSFTIAISLLTLFPGVDSLLVVRNSIRGGLPDGLWTSTGICCGLFIHATLSALGISAFLLHSATAYQLLKLAGGGYLLWLGLASLWAARGKAGKTSLPAEPLPHRNVSWQRSLREGLVCNVSNPKTLLFYMAFLPQFINPQRSALEQSLAMAAVHFVIAMIYQAVLAGAAFKIKSLFKKGGAGWWQRCADGVIGMLLISFGFAVFWDRR